MRLSEALIKERNIPANGSAHPDGARTTQYEGGVFEGSRYAAARYEGVGVHSDPFVLAPFIHSP